MPHFATSSICTQSQNIDNILWEWWKFSCSSVCNGYNFVVISIVGSIKMYNFSRWLIKCVRIRDTKCIITVLRKNGHPYSFALVCYNTLVPIIINIVYWSEGDRFALLNHYLWMEHTLSYQLLKHVFDFEYFRQADKRIEEWLQTNQAALTITN